ncbi:unnamed protein product [Linum tenue]|uniref:DNA-directed RNA polymerase n=1 Tax=Linum tenue TaxID=586396 RepID=A0AAV0QQZ8_9ROSI|nr:unnamed protein product [Linum tenue]
MHWSTDVYHAPEFTYSNVHLLPKTSHLWILSGCSRGFSIVPFSLHKDQDQINVHSLSVERQSILSLSVNNEQVKSKFFSSNLSGKKESRIPDYSELNRVICTDHCHLIYPETLYENSYLLAKRRTNRFIIPFQSIQEKEKELMPLLGISIQIPTNGIFRRNSIFAYFDDPQYRRNSSGITKYGALDVHSIINIKKEDLIEYRGIKEFKPKYQMKIDRFFFIPEEVYIFPESSPLMVRNNSIIGVDTQITLNTRSRVGGLIRVERKKKKFEVKIFSGDIHFPGATDKISRHSGILIPPGTVTSNSKKLKKVKSWIYVQRITPTKKRYFVLVRPVIIYEIADGINLEPLFTQDVLQEKDNLKFQVVNYILYGNDNGKPIRGILDTSIQLVRTCLVLNWDQNKKGSSIEEARASFVEVSIKGLVCNFLKIRLLKSHISYISKKKFFSDNGSTHTNINPFYFNYSKAKIQPSLKQNQGTISTLLNRNKESQSLIILSSSNCFRMDLFNDVKSKNAIKESIKRDPRIPITNSLGPLGAAPQIVNFFSFYHLMTHNQISINKYLKLDKLKQTFRVLKYYLMGENGRIGNPDPYSGGKSVLNPFNLDWYFLHENYNHNYCAETVTLISLGQFICENVCMAKDGPYLQSGQVIIVYVDSVVIRSAKPYLATPEATVHGHYGKILYEGDTLVTFIIFYRYNLT